MVEEEMASDLSQLVERIDPVFIQKQLQLMVEEAGLRVNLQQSLG